MTAVAGVTARRVPPPANAGARLDRLPATRWLSGVMAVLFLGWLVESYDIGVIGSVLPSLTHQFRLGTATESLVAISSTIGIVVGIVPAGRLADRFGRKSVLCAGTVVYAVLSVLTGFSSTIAEVVVLRVLAGLAMGAVFPLPYVYGAELSPAGLRGRFTGIADSFLSVGYFASPLIAMALIPRVSDPTGWRVMFFIGGTPLLLALLAWKVLPESPRWYEARGRSADAERVLERIEHHVEREIGTALPAPAPPAGDERPTGPAPSVRSLLHGRLLRRSAVLWVTFGGTFFLFYAVQTYLPTVAKSMGFTLTSAFVLTAVIVAASIPGKLLEAWLVERVGRRAVIVGFGLVAGVAAIAFGLLRAAPLVLVVGCVMSFFGIGLDPAVKVYTSESFPTAIRSTATAATEGFGRLLSGIVGPAFVPLLLATGGAGLAYGVVGGVTLLAVAVVARFGEETRGRSLEQLTPATLAALDGAGGERERLAVAS